MKVELPKVLLILGGKVMFFMDKIMLFNIKVIMKLMENIYWVMPIILIRNYKKINIQIQQKYFYGMQIITLMEVSFFFLQKINHLFVP